MQAKNKTYQRFAFFMAFWMLLTSSGIAIDAHYCQKELQRISFFGKAKSCQEILECMRACKKKKTISCQQKEAKLSSHEDRAQEGCCHNNTHVVQLDIDLPFYTAATTSLSEVNILSIAIPYQDAINLNNFFPENTFHFASYWPPPSSKDFLVFYQVFLC